MTILVETCSVKLLKCSKLLSRVRWYAWRGWRDLVRMIGFIGTLVTFSLLITIKYSAVADLHNLQFAMAHALGSSVSTSRLLATDINTETITISLNYTFQVLHINKVFKSHFKSSQADLLYSSVPLVPIRSQLIFTIHAPFSSFYSQLLNPPGLSTLSLSLKNWNLFKSKSHCDWRSVSQ
jgi:hypothetical protein